MRMPPEMRRKLLASDEGDDWVYRDPKKRVRQRVSLLSVPSDRPKRVRIQHLDADMRGAAEWVPAGRLEVPWSQHEEYMAAVETERRLESHAPDAVDTWVATELLLHYVEPSVADFYNHGASSALEVRDIAFLTSRLGEDAAEWLTHPDAIRDSDRLILPWPVFERVLTTLVALDPQPAMTMLDERTRRQQQFDHLIDTEGERWWMAEDATDNFAKRLRSSHQSELAAIATLKRWIGVRTPTVAESYIALRGMYTDLVAIIEEAIPRVRMGRSQTADRLVARMTELIDRPLPMIEVRGTPERSDEDG